MDNKEKLIFMLEEFENLSYLPGPVLQRALRFKAEALAGKQDEEQNLILHLVESHTPGLRFKTEMASDAHSLQEKDEDPILNKKFLSFSSSHPLSLNKADLDGMLARIREMPKEWTIVQITPHFCSEEIFAIDSEHLSTSGIHITVFNCGQSDETPFCITLPKNGNTGREDIRKLKNSLKEVLSLPPKLMEGQTPLMNNRQKRMYQKKKLEMEDILEAILRDLEDCWLSAWECLLIGKYKNESVEQRIRSLIYKFLVEESLEKVSRKVVNILVQAVKGTLENKYMMDNCIEIILEYCFPKKNIKSAWQIFWKQNCIQAEKEERHPVILILDETLDAFPWEMVNMLSGHPTSRMPSLHLLYAIFKAHEDSIIDGYKVISNYSNGKYILNPGLDLEKMEIRLKTFFEYWLPEWTGVAGRAPTSTEFRDLLTSADIFTYSGHGSGTQYCPSEKIQKKKINSVVFLFGCGSTQLVEQGPEVESYGTSQMYLSAACPCLIGMLWVVTDIDTDLLTTKLLSSWIPNKQKSHWQFVDKREWTDTGKVIISEKLSSEQVDPATTREPDLLRALCMAKNEMNYRCNKAAVVARGIPVKLVDLEQKMS